MSSANREVLQDIQYKYDAVGNITNIDQFAPHVSNGLGGAYDNHYHYDQQYRLILSEGNGDFPYRFKAAYSPTGRMGNKYVASSSISDDLLFGYDANRQTHQPRTMFDPQIGTTDCYWDANGNLAQVLNYKHNSGRLHEWDEENRLRFVLGEKHAGYYSYDADGERVYKLMGTSSIDQVNSGSTKAQAVFDRAALYPNPYIVVTPHGYTKHYYAGTERLATVIGGGGFDNMVSAMDKCNSQHETDIQKGFYTNYQTDDPFLHGKTVGGQEKTEDIYGKENSDLAYQCKPVFLEYLDVLPKTDILLSSVHDNTIINHQETAIFYYHGDHLGSANWITDANGKAIQYIHYGPYGELIANQSVIGYDERYKFTGKERDAETGYDYFGARYYSSAFSIWLSVDPLADVYPSFTPYMYCFGHVLVMHDPNGLGDPLTVMKVRRMAISNTFGMVRHNTDGGLKPHQGIDYQAPVGTDIMAVKSGLIVGCDFEGKGDSGKTITLQFIDENGDTGWAFYSHLSEIGVNIDDKVAEGDIIGKTGTSGNAKGMVGEDQHLHFEYRTGGAKLGKGLMGREDPNLIVDTKFEQDPNNKNKVRQVDQNL